MDSYVYNSLHYECDDEFCRYINPFASFNSSTAPSTSSNIDGNDNTAIRFGRVRKVTEFSLSMMDLIITFGGDGLLMHCNTLFENIEDKEKNDVTITKSIALNPTTSSFSVSSSSLTPYFPSSTAPTAELKETTPVADHVHSSHHSSTQRINQQQQQQQQQQQRQKQQPTAVRRNTGIPPIMSFDFGSLGFLAPFKFENFEAEVCCE